MKEADYSKKLVKAIKATGVHCYKTSDRFHAGIPDIYACGGIWIESKILKFKRHSNWHDKITTLQHECLTNFGRSGDFVLLAARCEVPGKVVELIVPYSFIDKHWIMDIQLADQRKCDVSEIFGPQHPRNINEEWYHL